MNNNNKLYKYYWKQSVSGRKEIFRFFQIDIKDSLQFPLNKL